MKGTSSKTSSKGKKRTTKAKRRSLPVQSSNLIAMLLGRNTEQSALFTSPDAALWRARYRKQHTTEIGAFKCMDGRLNLPVFTETPPGIIQPWRNLGGQFDMGWPFFGTTVLEWVDYAVSRGRLILPLVTYHWSRGDHHRGCKGFGYDTEAARAFTHGLREQLERVFGRKHSVVYPVQVGIETDEDALVLHGQKEGEILDLSTLAPTTDAETLRRALLRLFPDMNPEMVADLLPLLIGNIAHIAQIRSEHRPVQAMDHQEQVLAVGRGFGWLHWPNKALIVGPYSPDLSGPIAVAAGLLLSNIKEGRVPPGDGVVLMVSAVYRREAGPEKMFAMEKSRALARISQAVIAERVPELVKYMKTLVGVTNLNTLAFTPINEIDEES